MDIFVFPNTMYVSSFKVATNVINRKESYVIFAKNTDHVHSCAIYCAITYMDLSLHHSLHHYGRINVEYSDPKSDEHKESYDIANTAVIFLRSI